MEILLRKHLRNRLDSHLLQSGPETEKELTFFSQGKFITPDPERPLILLTISSGGNNREKARA